MFSVPRLQMTDGRIDQGLLWGNTRDARAILLCLLATVKKLSEDVTTLVHVHACVTPAYIYMHFSIYTV